MPDMWRLAEQLDALLVPEVFQGTVAQMESAMAAGIIPRPYVPNSPSPVKIVGNVMYGNTRVLAKVDKGKFDGQVSTPRSPR